MSQEYEPTPNRLTLEHVSRIVCETDLRYGEFIPTLIVEGSARYTVAQMPDFPKTFQERADMLAASGVLLGRSGRLGRLEQVFFICESWLNLPGSDDEAHLPSDPNPKKILFVIGLDVGVHRGNMVIFEIVHNGEEVMALEPFQLVSPTLNGLPNPLLEACHRISAGEKPEQLMRPSRVA